MRRLLIVLLALAAIQVALPAAASAHHRPCHGWVPCEPPLPPPSLPPPGGPALFFASLSPFNLRVPPGAALDPDSSAIVSRLAEGQHVVMFGSYGVPIYDGTRSPRYPVTCTAPWGTCHLERESVPLEPWFAPSPGSDGAMVVLDWTSGRSYEFWQYRWNGGSPEASWGDVAEVFGAGTPSQATGAGVSRLAGVVLEEEMAAGYIPHALVFSTDSACRWVYRYPASKTDGAYSGWPCIPEGARVQLDPALDVYSLGLSPGELAVARALQEFGAYAIDNGGARMAFVFETNFSGEPWRSAGFAWDYFDMWRIPWSRLRVMRSWDGS